jgi:hypothetical protein
MTNGECCNGGGCDGGNVEAQGVFSDIPFGALKTLLDTISGAKEFNLQDILAALTTIAEYVATLPVFDAESAEPCTDEVCVQALLQELCDKQESVSAQSVSATGLSSLIPAVGGKVLMNIIIKKALEWLTDYLNKK